MSVTQSDKYFFPRGDTVIQVANKFFKVHKDLLERYSGHFENIFREPTTTEEGESLDNPLHLSEDLCSVQAFTMICKFLYPADLGKLPSVTVKDLDIWEPVLDAAINLNIPNIQDRILEGLVADKKNHHLATPRLLKIAYRTENEVLKWDCYFDLFYRIRPMSLTDAVALGSSNLALITHVREQVQNNLIWDLTPADVDTSKLCNSRAICSQSLVEAIQRRMNTPTLNNPFYSVFDVLRPPLMCANCCSQGVTLARSYRTKKLDQQVRDWVAALLPLPISDSDDSESASVSG
ncbi:hypothetical protein BDV93DRAFT_528283 [Ceratobasidium sp. AG-I]|nr:hypothetical protein BDV93DRAFT_528283 [Ceratobasidium sp. AG-I]